MSYLRLANLEQDVAAEQVRYLYSNARRSVPFNVINPMILVLVFWPMVQHGSLLAWLGALSLVSLVRLVHARRVLERADFRAATQKLARRFMVPSTVTALLWGLGFITVAKVLPAPYQMLYLLTLGGMSAGAFTSMGTHRTCYLLFLGGVFIPVLAVLAFQDAALSTIVGVLVILFVAMLAATHWITHGMLVDAIRNRIENELLVHKLEESNSKLEAANAELEVQAETDSLTGIPNRRHFEQRFTLEWQRARRSKSWVACLLFDVDYFKQFNDLYGHAAGDQCLKRIAATLREHVGRPSDIVARYGGEEFIVVLPETAWEGAEVVAGRLKRAIEDLAIRHTASPASRYITVCVGVAAALPERLSEKRALVNAADEALYRAKRQGRNRVALAGPGTRSSPPVDRKIPAA